MERIEALNVNGGNFVPEDKFLRRIHPLDLKPTGEISSAAFQNDKGTNSFSTNWLKLSSVEETLKNHSEFGVASISAKLCWGFKQEIEWEPLDDNVAHCEIVGHKTRSLCQKMRDGAEYIVYPKKLVET